MDIRYLEEIGLTNTESQVYLMLLKEGSSLAGRITRNTGIHRRSVYDAIERLVEKGLVSYIKTNNRKYFEAADPKKLIDIIEQKKEGIESVMPELELMKSMSKEQKETTFFRGKQALKTVFDDQIKEGKEILVMGACMNADEIVRYYFPHFDKERRDKKIKIKMIFDESAKGTEYVKKIPLSEIKYLPKNYATPVATNIYSDKVAIILWSDNPIAILIKEKQIADSYRKYFELMWGMAKA